LDRYIALEQMESMWNKVNNDSLSYSWQRSGLEIVIPSWDIWYHIHFCLFTLHQTWLWIAYPIVAKRFEAWPIGLSLQQTANRAIGDCQTNLCLMNINIY
jgi:hypothetical protein